MSYTKMKNTKVSLFGKGILWKITNLLQKFSYNSSSNRNYGITKQID